jgi:hypothetical protein
MNDLSQVLRDARAHLLTGDTSAGAARARLYRGSFALLRAVRLAAGDHQTQTAALQQIAAALWPELRLSEFGVRGKISDWSKGKKREQLVALLTRVLGEGQ